MADLTVTAASVAPVYPNSSITLIRTFTALAAITAGQSVFVDPTTGKTDLCDADSAGKEQFAGIALRTVAIGEPVRVLMRGECYGFDLSGLDYWDIAYASGTAGALADAANGTKTVNAGRVVPINDSDKTKVLFIMSDLLRNW